MANWYVDNEASGLDNGTSWTNAWPALDAIVWGSLDPGDTLYISGGESDGDKTYNDVFSIGASGSSGSRLTIRNGVDEGHTGRPYIPQLVEVDERDYVTLYGLWAYCDNDHGTIYLQESESPIVDHCRITTPNDSGQQTDGIYSQRNNNAIYRYNHIVISNNNSSPHCDCIQSYQDEDLTIYGNWAEQASNITKTSNAQGIFCSTGAGTVRVYNNVAISPTNYGCNNISCRRFPSLGGTQTARIYNNISIGGGNKIIYVTEDSGAVVKNNVFWFTGSVYAACSIGNDGHITPANLDYNIWYSPNQGTFGPINDNSISSWAEMQSEGYEAHGYNENPDLDSGDEYRSLEGSPCIGNGIDLSAFFTIDKDGNTRSVWDIGAYEYDSGTPPAPGPSRLVMVLS